MHFGQLCQQVPSLEILRNSPTDIHPQKANLHIHVTNMAPKPQAKEILKHLRLQLGTLSAAMRSALASGAIGLGAVAFVLWRRGSQGPS